MDVVGDLVTGRSEPGEVAVGAAVDQLGAADRRARV
jgi:hypothetical protein